MPLQPRADGAATSARKRRRRRPALQFSHAVGLSHRPLRTKAALPADSRRSRTQRPTRAQLGTAPVPVGQPSLHGLLGLVVAEAMVFLMVAWVFGGLGAVFALLATSVLGILVLARMGRRLAGRVADILSRRDFGAAGSRSSGLL